MEGYIQNKQKFIRLMGFLLHPYTSHSGSRFERVPYFLEDAVYLTFFSVLVKQSIWIYLRRVILTISYSSSLKSVTLSFIEPWVWKTAFTGSGLNGVQ